MRLAAGASSPMREAEQERRRAGRWPSGAIPAGLQGQVLTSGMAVVDGLCLVLDQRADRVLDVALLLDRRRQRQRQQGEALAVRCKKGGQAPSAGGFQGNGRTVAPVYLQGDGVDPVLGVLRERHIGQVQHLALHRVTAHLELKLLLAGRDLGT